MACHRGLDPLVDTACACDTPECSDAAERAVDEWIDHRERGGDRDHDSAELARLQACIRRFEDKRRAGHVKMMLEVTPARTPTKMGGLTVPSPTGFAATGDRFVGDDQVEWVFARAEPADSAEAWLSRTWPLTIARYRDVQAGAIETLAGPAGWHVASRTATATDEYGHPVTYWLIAACRDGRVYPSDVEAPAPFDAEQRAAILDAIAGFQTAGG